ncbi:MAG: hypothetical protein HOW97_11475 [Catenulispora sp.]|nr:hypothetical protein [Catenulispora sp.]
MEVVGCGSEGTDGADAELGGIGEAVALDASAEGAEPASEGDVLVVSVLTGDVAPDVGVLSDEVPPGADAGCCVDVHAASTVVVKMVTTVVVCFHVFLFIITGTPGRRPSLAAVLDWTRRRSRRFRLPPR